MADAQTTTPAPVERRPDDPTWRKDWDRWNELAARWHENQREGYSAPDGESNEAAGRRLEREQEILREIIATHAPFHWAIAWKLDLAARFMDQGAGWTDHRDVLLIASARADVSDLPVGRMP